MQRWTLCAVMTLGLGAALAVQAQPADNAVSDAVDVFSQGCLDSLPDFQGASAGMTRLGGTEDRETWTFANGVFASVLRRPGGTGCLVTVPGGPAPVVASMSDELKRKYGSYQLMRNANGQPAAIVDAPSGRVAVIIAPDMQRNMTTLIAQPAPNN